MAGPYHSNSVIPNDATVREVISSNAALAYISSIASVEWREKVDHVLLDSEVSDELVWQQATSGSLLIFIGPLIGPLLVPFLGPNAYGTNIFLLRLLFLCGDCSMVLWLLMIKFLTWVFLLLPNADVVSNLRWRLWIIYSFK